MPARKLSALVIVATLLLAACSVAATPGQTAPARSSAPTGHVAATAGATEPTSVDTEPAGSPTDVPTDAAPPPSPKNFVAVEKDGSVPCPSPDSESGDSCKEVDLTWTSTTPGTWFRIYAYWTGEGDVTCSDAGLVAQASPILVTDPDATSAKLYNAMATGGGAQCLWITANSDAGESDPLAAKGQ